jgi:hypothetical protein
MPNMNYVRAFRVVTQVFPAPGITLWFINKTILLPSEY